MVGFQEQSLMSAQILACLGEPASSAAHGLEAVVGNMLLYPAAITDKARAMLLFTLSVLHPSPKIQLSMTVQDLENEQGIVQQAGLASCSSSKERCAFVPAPCSETASLRHQQQLPPPATLQLPGLPFAACAWQIALLGLAAGTDCGTLAGLGSAGKPALGVRLQLSWQADRTSDSQQLRCHFQQ